MLANLTSGGGRGQRGEKRYVLPSLPRPLDPSISPPLVLACALLLPISLSITSTIDYQSKDEATNRTKDKDRRRTKVTEGQRLIALGAPRGCSIPVHCVGLAHSVAKRVCQRCVPRECANAVCHTLFYQVSDASELTRKETILSKFPTSPSSHAALCPDFSLSRRLGSGCFPFKKSPNRVGSGQQGHLHQSCSCCVLRAGTVP